MSRRSLSILLLFAGAWSAMPAAAASNADAAFARERAAAAHVLAFGKAPAATTLEQLAQSSADRSIADQLTKYREQLRRDEALRGAVALRAFVDAHGRRPEGAEAAAGSPEATYTDLMQAHVRKLAEDPAAQEQVLHRAYQFVVQRDAYAEEITYWRSRDTLPYVMLVACVEHWARRNQPGLMVTAGVPTVSINSSYLATVRLSPAIADEARAAAGLQRPEDAWFEPESHQTPSAFGHNVVAAGAAQISSGGRIHFVAMGGGLLQPARE